MYDLRDPNYVPPHLRPKEPEPAPDNVLPFVRQETPEPQEPPESMLRSKQTGLRYTWACAEAAIVLMRAVGVAVGDEESGYYLRPDLEGLSDDALAETMLTAIGKLFADHREGNQGVPGRPAKYPFATMAVGDSFVLPADSEQPSYESFRVYCLKRGRTLERKFKLRKGQNNSYVVTREA